ncbi:YcnI family protein [Phytomonospora sp. NPDC050363]|uniref:YcnI family copper-binding membrane protein n=1 Tax=Phytomonospora sp. NPDC050363 TaxID=3155642 RepID=UPI00340DDAB7
MSETLRTRRGLRRLAVVAGIAAFGAVAMAGPASAHVTINPGEAEAGSYARLDLRIPNESEAASTVKIELTLPADHPFASVRTNPIDGWKVETKKATLATPLEVHGRQITEAVSTVTWTADSPEDGVQPGQFVEFGLSLGPVPDVAGTTLVFKAIQTYSDDTEAAWIEDPPAAGGAEPEKPAPTLKVVAATGGGHGSGTAATDDDADDAADHDDDAESGAALWVAIGAGVVALAGLGVAIAALRKRSA